MRLEQHIYTSNKAPVFSTIATTEGVSRLDCAKLEEHSQYYLPPTLLFRPETEGPVKYVYYPLDEQRSVIGKAVYTGRDVLGRPGNYLFHNFIIQKEALLTLDSNPILLIDWLDNQRLFVSRIPGEPLHVVNIPELIFTFPSAKVPVLKDSLVKILFFCHNYNSIGKPFLLTGNERQCLDFLHLLYYTLPVELRSKISFDTYAYGTETTYNIVCLPDEAQFSRPIQYAVELNLTDSQISSNITLKGPTESYYFVAHLVSTGLLNETNTLHKLEYLLYKGDYSSFKEGLRKLPPNIRNYLVEHNRPFIVNNLKSENDMEMLSLVTDALEPRDIEILAANFKVIKGLVEQGDERILNLFIMWFYKHKTRTEYYPLLFSSPGILKMFLKWIDSCYYDLKFLVDSFKLLRNYYSEESESLFLDKALSVLRHLKTDEKLGAEFYQTLKSLPEPPSNKAHWLRRWIEYELSGKEDLLKELVTTDINDIPERYRDLFKATFLKQSYKAEPATPEQPGFFRRSKIKRG